MIAWFWRQMFVWLEIGKTARELTREMREYR